MANADSNDIEESSVEDENKVDIEETLVRLDGVKNELNDEGLIGFESNDVIMEKAMIKLEAISEDGEESFNNSYCSKCKGIYNGYCSKCSTLLCILNNLSSKNSAPEFNMPTNILEIRETSRGKRVYLLRTLPKSIRFGPFGGILSNVESGNWMKNIVCAPNASLKNLDIFQFDGNLYFQTNREITVGEELLIYYDDGKLQQMDNSEEYLYIPQKMEKLPKVFACTMCCFGFGSNKCLMEHKKKCCLMEYSKGTKDFVLVECSYCKMWMEKREHEEYHVMYCLEKHHRILDFQRRNANKAGETPSKTGIRLLKKRSNRDKRSTHSNTNEKEYKCSECSYKTKHKYSYKCHLNTHLDVTSFQCKVCKKYLSSKMSLTTHMQHQHSTTSEKEYKCSECLYQTNYKYNYKSHLNAHLDVTSFQCKVCEKYFSVKLRLKQHMQHVHLNTTEQKYKCLRCSFQTKYKHNFQKHLYTHSYVTPFQCNICKIYFSSKISLKQHIQYKHLNTTEHKYNCPECSFQTNYSTSYKGHLNTHLDVTPFQCDICKTYFSTKGGLKYHMKNHHSNTNEKKCETNRNAP